MGLRRARDIRYQAPPLLSRALKRSGSLGTRLIARSAGRRSLHIAQYNHDYDDARAALHKIDRILKGGSLRVVSFNLE